MSEPHRAPNLPTIHPAAWHGAIGDTVRLVAPHTEADPAAILATLLGLFGAVAGDTAWVRVGGARHPARLWPLIVGKTGSGRKGTSMAESRTAVRGWSKYAEAYARSRVVSGLASGEGLIAALGGAVGSASDGPESGPVAPDGKLTVVETEFARVLSASKRDGSTLGPILRQLWDDGQAAILTRAAPLSVQQAHVTVVAHVTPQELKLRLAEADLAGGTLNRFLLIASERPHLIPHEARTRPDLAEPSEWLGKALDAARFGPGEVHRDRQAEALWEEVYAALSEDEPDGQLGSVLARGPAYTMRLALTYALADCDNAIRPRHLLAGLAVWQYAAATAKRLFPHAGHDRRADLNRLAGYLEAAAAGRSRTEINRLFGGNRTAGEIGSLLDELERREYVEAVRTPPAAGRGRPSVTFQMVGGPYVPAADPMTILLSRYERTE